MSEACLSVDMCTHVYVFSTILAEEALESMVQSMRNQDEQKAGHHVLSVTCNPQFCATLKNLSYRIILHLEIQCPL